VSISTRRNFLGFARRPLRWLGGLARRGCCAVLGLGERGYALWLGRSLIRTAKHGRASLAQTSPWRRRRRDAWDWLVGVLRAESSFWWLFVLFFGFVWLPIRWGFRLFATGEKTPGFLQALWQVEGATLAISLAVVIFVFQAVYASRLNGSLRQFAEETFLFPIFFSGVYSIGLVGFVLLGGGYGAPDGWAATWATLTGGLVGLLLIFLFIWTIRAIEPGALHKRRLARARREIERDTERVILERIAINHLSKYCEEHGVEFSPYSFAPSETAIAVRAQRDGEVRDLKLRELRRLGERASEIGLSKPVLRVYPSVRVSKGYEVLWVEPQVLETVALPDEVVEVGKREERAFVETLQRLHDEATRLLADPMPAAYGEILAVYEDMIATLPATWAEYGQKYGPDVAGGTSLFERDFLDLLQRNLYDEMRTAVLGSNREIAHDALHFPLGIAYRAIDQRASALSGRMLTLLVQVIAVVARTPDLERREELLGGIALSLDNYGDFRLEPLITDEASDVDTREFGRTMMLQLYRTFAEICKRMLDIDPTQHSAIEKFNGIYEKYFRFWDPQHERPWRFELDHALQRGEDGEAIEALRAAVDAREAEVALHDELDDARLVQRFGLMFWVLRRLRETGRQEWAEVWPVFANYIGDVSTLARISERAIGGIHREEQLWSDWIMQTLPSGEAHAIGVDEELIDAFIVRGLQLIPLDGQTPEVPPMEWTPGRLSDPLARIKAVTAQANFALLLPADRLDERVDVLGAALIASNQARQDREDQKAIDAPVSDAKLEAFEIGLSEAFERERWLHGALEAAGAVDVVAEDPPETVHGTEINRLIPKDLFIDDTRVVGGDGYARQYGVAMATHEREIYIGELGRAAVTVANAEEPLADQLRTIVAAFGEDGYEASLILCPSSWTTLQSLQLEHYRGQGGELEAPAWAETSGNHVSASGSFDGVTVCQVFRGVEDRIFVVDLSRFANWRDWTPNGETIRFRFKTYNDVEAEQLAQDKPDLFGGDVAARTKSIRMSIWLRAETRYEMEVSDLGAARALEIPEGLR
jgi:hypothetical protein